jgi:hypothetical protein
MSQIIPPHLTLSRYLARQPHHLLRKKLMLIEGDLPDDLRSEHAKLKVPSIYASVITYCNTVRNVLALSTLGSFLEQLKLYVDDARKCDLALQTRYGLQMKREFKLTSDELGVWMDFMDENHHEDDNENGDETALAQMVKWFNASFYVDDSELDDSYGRHLDRVTIIGTYFFHRLIINSARRSDLGRAFLLEVFIHTLKHAPTSLIQPAFSTWHCATMCRIQLGQDKHSVDIQTHFSPNLLIPLELMLPVTYPRTIHRLREIGFITSTDDMITVVQASYDTIFNRGSEIANDQTTKFTFHTKAPFLEQLFQFAYEYQMDNALCEKAANPFIQTQEQLRQYVQAYALNSEACLPSGYAYRILWDSIGIDDSIQVGDVLSLVFDFYQTSLARELLIYLLIKMLESNTDSPAVQSVFNDHGFSRWDIKCEPFVSQRASPSIKFNLTRLVSGRQYTLKQLIPSEMSSHVVKRMKSRGLIED